MRHALIRSLTSFFQKRKNDLQNRSLALSALIEV